MVKVNIFSLKMLENIVKRVYDIYKIFDAVLTINGIGAKSQFRQERRFIMVKLIIGLKGSGKTKTLISKVNEAIDVSNGCVVCLEKGDKLRFDIKYQARLIDVTEYDIVDAHGLQGFVAGLYASNSDITHLFIDSALKICGNDREGFATLVDVVNAWAEKWNVEVLMTSSISETDLPESLKKYL